MDGWMDGCGSMDRSIEIAKKRAGFYYLGELTGEYFMLATNNNNTKEISFDVARDASATSFLLSSLDSVPTAGLTPNPAMFRLQDRTSINQLLRREADLRRQADLRLQRRLGPNVDQHNDVFDAMNTSITERRMQDAAFRAFFISVNVLGLYLLHRLMQDR